VVDERIAHEHILPHEPGHELTSRVAGCVGHARGGLRPRTPTRTRRGAPGRQAPSSTSPPTSSARHHNTPNEHESSMLWRPRRYERERGEPSAPESTWHDNSTIEEGTRAWVR
jgi:hypothetical protein